jgi:hypothetical protein
MAWLGKAMAWLGKAWLRKGRQFKAKQGKAR